jgi:hypothetical protein
MIVVGPKLQWLFRLLMPLLIKHNGDFSPLVMLDC